MILDDDELEQVSGGGFTKTEDKYPCIYCHGGAHEMIKVYPWTVRMDGKTYNNLERYVCPATLRSFYISTERGRRFAYDDKMMLMPM